MQRRSWTWQEEEHLWGTAELFNQSTAHLKAWRFTMKNFQDSATFWWITRKFKAHCPLNFKLFIHISNLLLWMTSPLFAIHIKFISISKGKWTEIFGVFGVDKRASTTKIFYDCVGSVFRSPLFIYKHQAVNIHIRKERSHGRRVGPWSWKCVSL